MYDQISFRLASEFPPDEVPDLHTRTLAGYFVQARITTAELDRIVHVTHVHLGYSPFHYVGATRVGLATLALRGTAAHVRGFGVTLPYRGRGLSHVLFAECIARTRAKRICSVW
jgi:hypothetical protein